MLNKIKEYMSSIKKTIFLRVLAVTPWWIQAMSHLLSVKYMMT